MAIYIPKPEPIEVYQWLKNGDMPGDGVINNINSGAIVGRHVTYGNFTGGQICHTCNRRHDAHGTIKKRMGDLPYVICPGDWVKVYRDHKKKIIGYSVITAKVLHTWYVDLATIPQPALELPKGTKK